MPPDTDRNADAALEADLDRAAGLIRRADALVVAAGAGMGVDSGLPDFRGDAGFWRAYPALGRLGLDFMSVASPQTFRRDPRLAWGFYGHRLNLYRRTRPHDGFGLLRRWAALRRSDGFVFTSNVDGHFQRSGWADAGVLECHGSIHWLQCARPCHDGIWSADGFEPLVDEAACRLESALPACPRCGAVARPNILMFGDGAWLPSRAEAQEAALSRWLASAGAALVVVEIGAGTAVPSVRRFAEAVAGRDGGALVRINLREADVPRQRDVSLAMTALSALRALDARLGTSG